MNYATTNLRYFLLRGPVRLEDFRILDSQRGDWRDWRIEIYALGASHAIALKHNDTQITELLSCGGGASFPQIIIQATGANPIEFSTHVMNLEYRFRLTQSSLPGNDTLLGRFPHENQFDVAYPIKPGFDTPITRIGWRLEPNALVVETIHTYPEEGRIVRSESQFKIS